MDTGESKGPIDFDFFSDDAEKDSQTSKHRPTNGIRHLSKESLSQHDKAMHSTDNTRPSEAIQTNGRFKDTNLSDSDNDSTSDDSSESESDGERTARTVSSRSTNISVKVPSALDNISDTDSDGNSSGASRDSENDDRENNNEIRPKKENGHELTTGIKNPEPKETPSGSEKKASHANARPKTAKAGRKHHDSWTSEDVSDRNGSDLSRSFSSSETESKSSGDSDSDSSVTDVSPIHSPDRSRKCEGLDKSFGERQKPKERSRKADTSVRFVEVTPGYSIHGKSRSQNQDSETRELSMLLRAVLEMDECPSRTDLESLQRKMNRPSSGRPRRGGKRPQSAQLPHQRMNMSFSNNEVQKIDRENQRLLGKILHNKPQVPATRNSKVPGSSETPGQHMSHASVRRKREQRKIELENMQILQRIESAKATPSVRKDDHEKHYQRQVQYSNQVGKSPHRPSSARRTGSTYANKMAKASSMSSLNSDFSKRSTGSRPSSGRQSIFSESRPPAQSRPAWDEHWQVG